MATRQERDKEHAKRRGMPAAHGGAPAAEKDESEVRWLISYSDFMMQLVCLFILLYSVSSLDTGKAARIAQSWREEVGLEEVRVPPEPGARDLPLTAAELPAAIRDMEVALARYPEGGTLRVSPAEDGFRLQIVAGMFEEGKSALTPEGERRVDLAAMVLRPYQRTARPIEIVGHASAGNADREEGSALRLSLSRAWAVHGWLLREGAPHRLDRGPLLAGGRGAHDPIGDGSDPATRRLNRRVDFVVRLKDEASGDRR